MWKTVSFMLAVGIALGCTWSGARADEVEFDTDRIGSDYANFPLTDPDYRHCAQACSRDQRCKAWTYVRPGIQWTPTAPARCYLKNSMPPKTAGRSCCVSGLRVVTILQPKGPCWKYERVENVPVYGAQGLRWAQPPGSANEIGYLPFGNESELKQRTVVRNAVSKAVSSDSRALVTISSVPRYICTGHGGFRVTIRGRTRTDVGPPKSYQFNTYSLIGVNANLVEVTPASAAATTLDPINSPSVTWSYWLSTGAIHFSTISFGFTLYSAQAIRVRYIYNAVSVKEVVEDVNVDWPRR